MADIAFAFHWPPAVMRRMSVEGLMAWHARAMLRLKAIYSFGGK